MDEILGDSGLVSNSTSIYCISAVCNTDMIQTVGYVEKTVTVITPWLYGNEWSVLVFFCSLLTLRCLKVITIV